jgi:hypothetical protein
VVRELPEARRPAHGALVVPAVEARPSTLGEGRSAVLFQPDRLRVCVVSRLGCVLLALVFVVAGLAWLYGNRWPS